MVEDVFRSVVEMSSDDDPECVGEMYILLKPATFDFNKGGVCIMRILARLQIPELAALSGILDPKTVRLFICIDR